MPTAKLALVGDRSPSVRAHGRIPLLIDALRRRDGLVLDPYWIPSTEAEDLTAFDGIWVVPGSPYSDPEKVIDAVRTAREHGIPFLGTCGGFQHAILELARDLAGIEHAHHAEYGLTDEDVIVRARMLARRPRGPDPLHARDADRADRRRRAQPRALPLRLRDRDAVHRDARTGGRHLRRARRGRSAPGARARATIRSSSARSSSPNWPATATARTRSSAPLRRPAPRASLESRPSGIQEPRSAAPPAPHRDADPARGACAGPRALHRRPRLARRRPQRVGARPCAADRSSAREARLECPR